MKKTFGILIAALSLVVPASFAAEDIPKEGGFSGYVLFGGGYLDAETNLRGGNDVVDIATETVSSIDLAPQDSQGTAIPLLTGEVKYTLNGRPMQFFLGGQLEDLVTLESSQGLGFRWQPGKSGIYEIRFLSAGLPEKVWADPYVAGTPRVETDQTDAGVRIGWAKIFGTGLEITLSSRSFEVDQEASGSGLGLSAAGQDLLRRDGDRRQIEVSYDWRIGDRHRLEPKLLLRQEDRDGEAMSGDGAGVQLSYAYLTKPFGVVTTLLVGKKSFDAENPVYGIEQDADVAALSVTAFYALGGGGRWSLVGNASWAEENSDVDFHDSTTQALTVGAQYRF